MITTAYINIWGKRVGALDWDPENGIARLEYDHAFIGSGIDLAPLTMPLSAGRRVHSFPALRMLRDSDLDCYRGLPGLVADSLPDRYGNELMNIWAGRNGRGIDDINPIEQLCFIGKRGMGALEYEPTAVRADESSFDLELAGLIDMAQRLFQERGQFRADLSHHEEEALVQILKVGTSAGGARPKALIAYNAETGAVQSGQTDTPDGFEQYLLKMDGVSDAQFGSSKGYGRVEMAYYLMATHCGIEMMESQLIEEEGRAHFMTKRFDRMGKSGKRHIQTLCAMRHFDYNRVTSYSYEQLFETMRALQLTYPEADQLYRRMVFNVLARNCDDHTKNFAFALSPGERWRLAPAYDVCHAYRPESRWVSQHALSINGKRQGIERADLLAIAKRVNIRRPDQIIDEVQAAVTDWSRFAQNVGLDRQMADAIASTFVRV